MAARTLSQPNSNVIPFPRSPRPRPPAGLPPDEQAFLAMMASLPPEGRTLLTALLTVKTTLDGMWATLTEGGNHGA